MSDLEHVASVLSGSIPTVGRSRERPEAGVAGTRSRQDRNKKSRRGSSAMSVPVRPSPSSRRSYSSSSDKKARNSRHRPATVSTREPLQPTSADSQPCRPEPSPDGTSNSPGSKSTNRLWHCTACDVWVPRRPGDWEVHCRGIRHQRHLLSLKVHGERGRLVLSTFESLPSPDVPAYRIAGRGGSQIGLDSWGSAAAPYHVSRTARTAASQGSSELPQDLRCSISHLRTQALAQLLNLFGAGQTYSAASQELSEHLLWQAASQPPLDTRWPPPSGQLVLPSAAAVAVAAVKARVWGFDASVADIQVCLEGQPWVAVAASLAALCLLLNSLATSPHLQRLTLRLLRPDLRALPPYQLAQLERAWGGHVMRSVASLLDINPGVRSIQMQLPPPLLSSSQDGLPPLLAAAKQAPAACRQQLLLALHPRAGRCSPLQLLPLPLVREVLQLAAPLTPCEIALKDVGEGEGGGEGERGGAGDTPVAPT